MFDATCADVVTVTVRCGVCGVVADGLELCDAVGYDGECDCADGSAWDVVDISGYPGERLDGVTMEALGGLCEVLEQVGLRDFGAFEAWLDDGWELDALVGASLFLEGFMGEWNSIEEYATELFDDLYGDVISSLGEVAYYIDYGRFARDLLMGDHWTADSPRGVYVFRSV